MGLDTTHGCWNGAYGAFFRWRKIIADAANIPYPDPIELLQKSDAWEKYEGWLRTNPDSELGFLLAHSDCEGSIPAEMCFPLADALEELLVKIAPELDGGGHVGNVRRKTETFIRGLRLAGSLGEDVEFR